MSVKTRALDCSCGERLLSTSDEGLGKAIKDHRSEKHEDREVTLEEAVSIARESGFDPQDVEGDGNVDLTISR